MRHYTDEIRIPLQSNAEAFLLVYPDKANTIIEISPEEAAELGESPWQILEGCFYNYEFEFKENQHINIQLRESIVVKHLKRKDNKSMGRLSPNIYVGSLSLEVYNVDSNELIERIYIEVIPTKLNETNQRIEDSNYRENYEFMLGEIADKCTELILQIESPIDQNFEVDFNQEPQTIYQRFSFIKSLLNQEEFFEAIQKIISSPTSRWTHEMELMPVSRIRKVNRHVVRQLINGKNRIDLEHPISKLKSVPQKIEDIRKVETIDTHENRFIKHALESFLFFVQSCEDVFKKNNFKKSWQEATALGLLLENQLQHSFFKEISKPTVLKLNSPALQRKSGYREILNVWLKFDLSLRLVWKGGDDVYKAGKRDIAVLYEYWLFFKLYDLMQIKFNKKSTPDSETTKYSDLLALSKDGIQLVLRSGTYTALDCQYEEDGWRFNIRFSYNKTFSANRLYEPGIEGSWTKPMRPDYTLSIWPSDINSNGAELNEQIVHIHFDSKYKVQHFIIPSNVEDNLVGENIEGDEDIIDTLLIEKRDELKGIYKNADLLKMHAYKDAIRRTGGAYVLYPGTEQQSPLRGFHEIIPGLGAFPLRPTKSDNGIEALSIFLDDVIRNFKNSASQQKNFANKVYSIYKNKPIELNVPLPFDLVPQETHVLVGYYKSQEHLNWIIENQLYNFRMEADNGALVLNKETLSASFILLYGPSKLPNSQLFGILQHGPKVYSKDALIKLNYPSPNHANYLVFNLKTTEDPLLSDFVWDVTKLANYPPEGRGWPFTTSLLELMACRVGGGK